MTERVIQGFFPGGRACVPSAVMQAIAQSGAPKSPVSTFGERPLAAQPEGKPRPPGLPAPSFIGRPATAQRKALARLPGPPAPAFTAQGPVAQKFGANDSFAIDPGRLGLVNGGGKPLPDTVRGPIEAALGADFSAVRVHVGPQAARIGAIAFTTGNDIYFAPGRFQPDSLQGKQLLGHELVHVIQQRSGRVRNPYRAGIAIVQDHALEAEADRLGRAAAARHALLHSASPINVAAPTMVLNVVQRTQKRSLSAGEDQAEAESKKLRVACVTPAAAPTPAAPTLHAQKVSLEEIYNWLVREIYACLATQESVSTSSLQRQSSILTANCISLGSRNEVKKLLDVLNHLPGSVVNTIVYPGNNLELTKDHPGVLRGNPTPFPSHYVGGEFVDKSIGKRKGETVQNHEARLASNRKARKTKEKESPGEKTVPRMDYVLLHKNEKGEFTAPLSCTKYHTHREHLLTDTAKKCRTILRLMKGSFVEKQSIACNPAAELTNAATNIAGMMFVAESLRFRACAAFAIMTLVSLKHQWLGAQQVYFTNNQMDQIHNSTKREKESDDIENAGFFWGPQVDLISGALAARHAEALNAVTELSFCWDNFFRPTLDPRRTFMNVCKKFFLEYGKGQAGFHAVDEGDSIAFYGVADVWKKFLYKKVIKHLFPEEIVASRNIDFNSATFRPITTLPLQRLVGPANTSVASALKLFGLTELPLHRAALDRRYRSRALLYHPDKIGNNPTPKYNWTELQEAYEVLKVTYA